MTVPANGVTITNGVCSFSVSGTVFLSRAGLPPMTITPTDTGTVSQPLGLLVAANVVGCSPLIAVNGLTYSYTGTYSPNRSVTITLP